MNARTEAVTNDELLTLDERITLACMHYGLYGAALWPAATSPNPTEKERTEATDKLNKRQVPTHRSKLTERDAKHLAKYADNERRLREEQSRPQPEHMADHPFN